VARSSNGVLGPYEKSNQILIFGKEFWEPNLIIENERYHLIYGSWHSHFYLVSLKWHSDWPYAVSFTSLSSETAPVSIPTSCPVPITCTTPVTCPDSPEPKCPIPMKPSAETQDENNDFFDVDDNVERSKYSFHIHDNHLVNVYHQNDHDKE